MKATSNPAEVAQAFGNGVGEIWKAMQGLKLPLPALNTLQADYLKQATELWNQTLRHYRAQEWDQAEVALLNLTRMAPARGLYGKYMERVAQLRKNPPEAGWKGVWKFDTK